MQQLQRVGFGGGCHWCTEAVFQSLIGVEKVAQGFIASNGKNSSFCEAVVVHYNPSKIALKDLIAIHLHTHNSTSTHAMRHKYRSAIYTFLEDSEPLLVSILKELQIDFEEKLITQVLKFCDFKSSEKRFQNYYHTDKERPFCKTHIQPKLRVLLDKFSEQIKFQSMK